jgi:cytoplasmic iron level regulating protein YaaA (DUF328/UPF0246 family)
VPSPQPVILLPPSEGKAQGGDGPAWAPGRMADRALDRHRKEVVRRAKAAGATAARGPTMAAIDRYTGVLYRELAWATLRADARRRGADQIRIVSGLWGLVAPLDPIPAYRLKMSAALPDLGRLSTWWRPRMAPTLAARVEGAVVWDLLPIEHAAAVDWGACRPGQRVTFRFVEADGSTVNHWNKLLKGAVVRWLLADQPSDASAIAGFVHPLGYQYDPDASSSLEEPLVSLVLRRPA